MALRATADRCRPTAAARCLLAVGAMLLLLAGSLPVSAQVPDTTAIPSDAETDLEALGEDDLAGDPTTLLDLLASLREDPLDINTATAAELAVVPAFDPLVAGAIVRYREANGPFGSIPELTLVEGVTADVFLDARPYLRIGERLTSVAAEAPRFPEAPRLSTVLQRFRTQLTQRVQRRLDLAEGFLGPDSARAYPGSPERLYTRLQATYRRQLSLNLTLEHDPGEPFRWEPDSGSYGYDYLSGHAAILDAGRIDALIVGDFVAEFGQGVALWRAAGFGKGPDAVGGPVRSGRGLRPYGSVDENRFFRGAGLTLALTPSVYASGFASRRRLDAAVFVPDSLEIVDPDLPPGSIEGAIVTSLGADGLHRTARERARKDALGETLVGGGVEWRRASSALEARAGVVGYRATFDAPLDGGDRPDERFDFSGTDATMLSAYADATVRAGQVFAEVARGPSGAVGGVGGALAGLGPADLLVVGRHYPRDFTTLHGYPFGERNGVGQNETGLYTGLRVRPSRAWTVQTYFDQYRFPWVRFGIGRPSRGHEALLFVEHRPRRWLRLYAQARTETKEQGIDVPGGVPGSVVEAVAPETRQSLRVQGEWLATRRLRFRVRAEGVRFVPKEADRPVSTGALLYNDLRVELPGGVRLDTRLTLFSTDDFDARLYTYENDLLGVFAVPVLFGTGARTYALLTAEPLEGLRIQAKLGATVFRQRRSLGSGANEIQGDRVRDLGVQVRYRF